METDSTWKRKILLLGGLFGALTGLAAAYAIVRRAEREGEQLQLGASDGLKLGMDVLRFLRQVSSLGGGGGRA
jgi:hypothetical protein